MKKSTICMLAAWTILAVALAYHKGQVSQKHKNYDADAYAAEWGCLQASMELCRLVDLSGSRGYSMYDCEDNMTTRFCPESANRFRAFLSQSSR
jgi:hypothetical protein